MKLYELVPIYDKAKSFYGKAKLIEDNIGNIFLLSYDTVVCGFTVNGFERYWNGSSQTTLRHIKEAYKQIYNCNEYTKNQWDNTPVIGNVYQLT